MTDTLSEYGLLENKNPLRVGPTTLTVNTEQVEQLSRTELHQIRSLQKTQFLTVVVSHLLNSSQATTNTVHESILMP